MINARWEGKIARIRPTRRDCHGGRSDECLSCACIACRHYAIDSTAYNYNPLTCEEARGVKAPFKSFRVHSAHKGEEVRRKPVSRGEVPRRSIRASYPRPLMALSRQFRSCTGTSVLSVCPGSYSAVGAEGRARTSAWATAVAGGTSKCALLAAAPGLPIYAACSAALSPGAGAHPFQALLRFVFTPGGQWQ